METIGKPSERVGSKCQDDTPEPREHMTTRAQIEPNSHAQLPVDKLITWQRWWCWQIVCPSPSLNMVPTRCDRSLSVSPVVVFICFYASIKVQLNCSRFLLLQMCMSPCARVFLCKVHRSFTSLLTFFSTLSIWRELVYWCVPYKKYKSYWPDG